MPWWVEQVALMCAEACVVAALVLVLFRLRSRVGFAPLYVTLGVLQLLQNFLTAAIRIDFELWGLTVSPGSAVLFPVTLFTVLLVYMREDASEARHLVYGLLAANFSVTVLWSVFGLHVLHPSTHNVFNLPRGLFVQNAGMATVGLIILFCDALLIIILYEWLGRVIRSWTLARVFLTLATVLAIDSVIFVSAMFGRDPQYLSLVLSNLLLKTVVAVPLSLMLTLYLDFAGEVTDETLGTDTGGIRLDAFHRLTYRERYESVREQVVRDPLTGLYNRGFFDEVLPLTLERARRANDSASLLMLDIDDFKQLNDTYGHVAGDAVLRKVGEVLQDCARSADAPCRFGGDEFALVLPHADGFAARAIGERVRSKLAEVELKAEGAIMPLAVTIGVATFPTDAGSPPELIMLADRRLYRGKNRGGDALVDADTLAGPEADPAR